ncbi:MAG TPA: hypothetical protein DCG79_03260 [Clostridiales bacterium]|nr:hypothetical protein [Clostridiales bacterium]
MEKLFIFVGLAIAITIVFEIMFGIMRLHRQRRKRVKVGTIYFDKEKSRVVVKPSAEVWQGLVDQGIVKSNLDDEEIIKFFTQELERGMIESKSAGESCDATN